MFFTCKLCIPHGTETGTLGPRFNKKYMELCFFVTSPLFNSMMGYEVWYEQPHSLNFEV